LKKYLIGGVAALAMAVPAVAIAQLPAPIVTGDVKVNKANAGTAKKPTPVRFSFKAVNSAESQTTVSTIVLDLAQGVKLDGTRLPTCSNATLSSGGPSACPRGSRLGTGIAYAFLVQKNLPAPDCVGTNGTASGCLVFENTFFVGGKRLLNVWLAQRGGGVQKVLQGNITRGGRRLTIEIPRDLQSPAPAVYSALLQLSGSFQGQRRVGGRTYSFVSTTGCPRGNQWSFKTTFRYVGNPEAPLENSVSGENRQRCRK
jgi:hypothetical protein